MASPFRAIRVILTHYGIIAEAEPLQREFPGETSPPQTDSAPLSPLVASITVIGLLFLLGQKARPRKLAQSR